MKIFKDFSTVKELEPKTFLRIGFFYHSSYIYSNMLKYWESQQWNELHNHKAEWNYDHLVQMSKKGSTLLTISGFVLNERLQRNASKFAIFLE